MPNERLSAALETRRAQKKKPAKKPKTTTPKPDPAEVALQMLVQTQITAQERSDAVMEILQKLLSEDRTVTIQTGQLDDVLSRIGDTIANEISKMPAPIVNIPKREPIPYRVTGIQHDRQGRLSDAMIVPVVSDE